METLLIYLNQAQEIADKMYLSSRTYLTFGSFIAFVGVIFLTVSINSVKSDQLKSFAFTGAVLLEYLPRLGIFLFVEAVAFFFLRLYRANMEEYRYYEAIKRQRENQVAILKIVGIYSGNVELMDKIIDKCAFNDNPNKLGQNETTQLLEANKLSSKEADLLDKILEIINKRL